MGICHHFHLIFEFELTKSEAIKAFKELGINEWDFLKIPATMVHFRPIAELNKKIGDSIIKTRNAFFALLDNLINHRAIFDSSGQNLQYFQIQTPLCNGFSL